MKVFDFFLNQKRFDLIFKYLYVKYPQNHFAKVAYLENIRAFNGFFEENPSKNSAEDFIASFDGLIASIKQNGFVSNNVIPLGENGEIQDGAHRLSICAALNIGVEIELRGGGNYMIIDFLKSDQCMKLLWIMER